MLSECKHEISQKKSAQTFHSIGIMSAVSQVLNEWTKLKANTAYEISRVPQLYPQMRLRLLSGNNQG